MIFVKLFFWGGDQKKFILMLRTVQPYTYVLFSLYFKTFIIFTVNNIVKLLVFNINISKTINQV